VILINHTILTRQVTEKYIPKHTKLAVTYKKSIVVITLTVYVTCVRNTASIELSFLYSKYRQGLWHINRSNHNHKTIYSNGNSKSTKTITMQAKAWQY